MFTQSSLLVVILIFAVIPFAKEARRLSLRASLWIRDYQRVSKPKAYPQSPRKSPKTDLLPSLSQNAFANEEMQLHKDLFFKLQNLEQYPSVLPQSRDLLISLFAEKLSESKKLDGGILAMETFDPDSLATFLQGEDKLITERWKQYMERRRSGMPREMFKDLQHAKWWLKQISPVKYVDGAWLGHIHKASTPFPLRKITKNAWQIMSEELGDGDFSKNHVYLWRDLMNEIDARLPDADKEDFIHPRHEMNKPHVWKAAVAQLLISLFPHDFLPEILGFNMHFEMLTWDTMRAIKELKELKLNDYYFLLHISIDNADSGHTAMAMQAVVDYLQHIKQVEGEAAANKAWKRVQTGFVLSERLPTSPDYEPNFSSDSSFRNVHEDAMLKIFKAKVAVAHQLHCGSRMKIKSRSLVDWLDPVSFQCLKWQKEFLNALADTKPWVRKGDSTNSKLIEILSWDGKMFGAFTETEVEIVRKWIDSFAICQADPDVYWTFIGCKRIYSHEVLENVDIHTNYPVFSQEVQPKSISSSISTTDLYAPLKLRGDINLVKLVPLWFAHVSLLEGFVTVPFKTISPSDSAVVLVLRAQYGFAAEGSGVAGMDEFRRHHSIDLLHLGCEMMRQANITPPTCLKDALGGDISGQATELLQYSMMPIKHREVLLGMMWAFVGLHEIIASADHNQLLSLQYKKVLRDIAIRERAGLGVCLDEIESNESKFRDFCTGYERALAKISTCFE